MCARCQASVDSDVDRRGMCQFPVARAQERSNRPNKTEATCATALVVKISMRRHPWK